MKTKTLLRLYLVMSLLNEPLFWGPVLLLALAKLGHMSIEQIFISEAIAMALILILDAPSGVFADMIGRKKSVMIGKICILAQVICTAFMSEPIHGFIANILWAIGYSFNSGAKNSLIYDELKKRGLEKGYQSLLSKTMSYWFLILAGATLATGFLAEINLRLPLLLSIPGVVISTILTCFFPKESPYEHNKSLSNAWKHTKEAMQEVLRNKRLRSLVVWIALFGVVGKMYFFVYNPYLELVQIPPSQVGMVFCLINLVAYTTSKHATEIHEKLKSVGFSAGFFMQSLTMLTQAYFTHYLSGWLFGLQGFGRGYVGVIYDSHLQKEIASEKRATVLSLQSSLGGVLQIFGFLLMVPLSTNIPVFLGTLGIVALLFSFLSRKI